MNGGVYARDKKSWSDFPPLPESDRSFLVDAVTDDALVVWGVRKILRTIPGGGCLTLVPAGPDVFMPACDPVPDSTVEEVSPRGYVIEF